MMRARWLIFVGITAVAAACGGGSSHRAAVRTQTPENASSSTLLGNAASASSTVAGTHGRSAPTSTTPGRATTNATHTRGTGSNGSGDSNGNATGGGGGGNNTPPPTSGPVCVPVKYNPPAPVNLCGTPGVSAAEQARAEKLIRDTLRDIPKYANPQAAYNAGYRSIGDGFTGYEHYVKWSLVDDGHILDSTQPESLVYHGGTLVAAMYMTPKHTRFTDLPDIGGPLTQWHIHNNLCFRQNPNDSTQWTVTGLTDGNGNCPPGTTKSDPSPMIHVWIVSTPCGPFAALEGVGGGQVEPGDSPACDHLHGTG